MNKQKEKQKQKEKEREELQKETELFKEIYNAAIVQAQNIEYPDVREQALSEAHETAKMVLLKLKRLYREKLEGENSILKKQKKMQLNQLLETTAQTMIKEKNMITNTGYNYPNIDPNYKPEESHYSNLVP